MVPPTGGAGGWALAILFLIVTIALAFALLVYLVSSQVMRESFYLRVRMPSLVQADLMLTLMFVLVTGLRQAVVSAGGEFPCFVTTFFACISATSYWVIYHVRISQLILLFDSNLRQRYQRSFKGWKLFTMMFLPGISLIIFFLHAAGVIPLCRSSM
jgi:hypothetical protein